MRDLEYPFLFRAIDRYDLIAGLSPVDFAELVKILVRARAARVVGISIPMDKLLKGEPI